MKPAWLPEGMETPCQNEEVSGRRLENGEVVDLWFGQSGSAMHVDEAYAEAKYLCDNVCPKAAFDRCEAYRLKHKPRYGMLAGVVPPAT